jgi:predicted DNA-binding WGR domain protein
MVVEEGSTVNGWKCQISHLTLVDAETNASKFYDVRVLWNDTINDYRVLTTWGRIGTSGSSKVTLLGSKAAAVNWADNRTNQKVVGGYTLVEIIPEEVAPWMLLDAGINLHTQTVESGVSLDEMKDIVESALDMAINREGTPNPIDAAYAAARMNGKLQELQEKMDEIAAQAEYVNAAVRARAQVG